MIFEISTRQKNEVRSNMFHRACRANARRNVNVFWHITQCCLLFVICIQDTYDKKLTSTLQLIRLNYLILLSHGFLWNLVGKIHTLCTHAKNVCSCTRLHKSSNHLFNKINFKHYVIKLCRQKHRFYVIFWFVDIKHQAEEWNSLDICCENSKKSMRSHLK